MSPAASMPRPGRVRMLLLALIATCALGLLGAAHASADTWPWTESASALSFPNSLAPSDWELSATGCSTTDVCVAVGYYEDSSSDDQAYVAPVIAGVPQPGVEVTLPGDAAGDHDAELTDVACQTDDSCTAIGHYTNTADELVSMVVQIDDGVPSAAVAVTAPAGAVTGDGDLTGLACPTSGPCVAVGYDESSSTGDDAPWAVTLSGGVQMASEFVTPPADLDSSDPYAELESVACGASESCVAVGEYSATVNDYQESMVVPIDGGSPGVATAVVPPSNVRTNGPSASLDQVACPDSGACEAVGSYVDTAGDYANLAVSVSDGVPAGAVAVTPPSGVESDDPQVYYDGIACSSAALCVAGGYYYNAASDYNAAITLITASGATSQAVVQPADARTSGQESEIGDGAVGSSVACAASGSCLASGWYYSSADGGDGYEGLAELVSASGQVQTAETTAAPSDSYMPVHAYLYGGTACDAAGSCFMTGEYETSASAELPYGVAEQAPLTLSVPVLASAVQGTAYSETLSGAGGAWGSYSWSVSSGSLPAGLSLNGQTGVISGTPTSAGSSTFAVTVTAAGSPVQTASEQLALTVAAAPSTTTAPPSAAAVKPSVTLLSASGKVRASTVGVKLRCSGAACAGTVKLEVSETVTVKRGKKRVRKHEIVVLGSASYRVAVGKTKTVAVRLNGRGRRRLAAATRHRLTVTELVAVHGGNGASRRATIYTVAKKGKH